MRPSLAIGDFSQTTHLSVKTLRYYHRIGQLLQPADVDPGTGHRRFANDFFYVVGGHETPDETLWRAEIGWPIFHTGQVLHRQPELPQPDPTPQAPERKRKPRSQSR
jgi:hypothetical protein